MSVAMARLLRIADTPFGVFGYLDLLDGAGTILHRFCTAEEDWLDNQLRISCIPAGLYTCVRTVWHGAGGVPTWEITGVPGGRSRILFHWGNTEEDVMGCVLLGETFGALTVRDEDMPGTPATLKWAVQRSRPAFDRFMAATRALTTFPLAIYFPAPPAAWRAGNVRPDGSLTS